MIDISRRQFLGRSATGAGILALGPLLGGTGSAAPDDDRILVLVQLSGGNDGLSTVVPFADDAYGKARRRLRVPTKDVLELDDAFGLHPNLTGLKVLWDDGDLGIIQGVGYPEPNRSHFKSFDIWHAASPRRRRVGSGWVGRLCEHAFTGTSDPNLIVHVGNRTPYSLHGTTHPAVTFTTPRAYRWIGTTKEAASLEAAAPICEEGTSGRDRALATLRRALHDAQASSRKVRDAAARFRPAAPYPASRLSANLATVSALICGGLSTRIYSVELGGFDTHTNQKPRHDNLMTQVGDGLLAFMKDLTAHGVADRVTILVFSEFGRRVKENASGGTDHGVAGPSFVIGKKVNGGLHGKHPSLTDLMSGDLRHTTDFRRIYATLIDEWIGADHVPVLGDRWSPLPIFKS